MDDLNISFPKDPEGLLVRALSGHLDIDPEKPLGPQLAEVGGDALAEVAATLKQYELTPDDLYGAAAAILLENTQMHEHVSALLAKTADSHGTNDSTER
jgi:hypothetical protein